MDRANQAKAEAAQAKAEAETMAKLRNAQVGATRVEEGSLKERVHTLEIQLYTSKLSWLQKDMSDKDWISVCDEIQADLRRAKVFPCRRPRAQSPLRNVPRADPGWELGCNKNHAGLRTRPRHCSGKELQRHDRRLSSRP